MANLFLKLSQITSFTVVIWKSKTTLCLKSRWFLKTKILTQCSEKGLWFGDCDRKWASRYVLFRLRLFWDKNSVDFFEKLLSWPFSFGLDDFCNNRLEVLLTVMYLTLPLSNSFRTKIPDSVAFCMIGPYFRIFKNVPFGQRHHVQACRPHYHIEQYQRYPGSDTSVNLSTIHHH